MRVTLAEVTKGSSAASSIPSPTSPFRSMLMGR